MLKKVSHYRNFMLLGTILLFAQEAISQNIIDTIAQPATFELNDTSIALIDTVPRAVIDSSSMVSDSTVVDSVTTKTSKFDFLSTGGNDSTYYSFYGHLFNVDDTNIMEGWIYNNQVHEPVIFNYDSTLNDLHIYHPAFKNVMNNGYLGNSGLAVQSNIFAEPNPHTEFIFLQSFTPYIYIADEAKYYNVLKPFTVFRVDIGPSEEQNLEILHTQNINKYFNAFVRFKNYTGKGKYLNQATRNNAGTIGGSYTKGRLASHFNWALNRIDAEENGGITDKYWVTDTLVSPGEMNTRLQGGKNYVKDRQLFFDQKIGFLRTNVPDSAELGGYWFSLQYTYNRHKSSKIYTDKDDTYITTFRDTLNLYTHTYNGTATFDSTSFFYKNHNFRINLEENPRTYPFVGAYFGYGLETKDYYYFNKDINFDNSQSNEVKSSYFEAGMYRLKGKKFKFSGNYKIFISGYRQADMQMDGFLSQKFGKEKREFELKGEGLIAIKTPDYLLSRYYSNHYRWENNFLAEKRTTFHFSLSYPHYNTKIGSRFNILSDYIYFNQDAMPSQYSETFSVYDVYMNNHLTFGKFGLNTRLNYQQSSNTEILPLPEFSGYAALFWNPKLYFSDTGGKLQFQLGTDVYYWTSYYGQAYSPALARFYNQSDMQVGNYPFVGVFTNFEIKRLRFYIRYEHANYRRSEPRNYFYTPYYPSNVGSLRYGLVWTFYD